MGNSFRHLRQLHSNLRFRCELFDELLDVISVGRSMGDLKVSFSKGWKSWASCWFNVHLILLFPFNEDIFSSQWKKISLISVGWGCLRLAGEQYMYNTSNFPPVLFLWYWNKREDILSFPPVLIAFIVLIVFRDVCRRRTIPLLLINCWRNKAVRCGNDRSWLEIKSISRWLTWSSTKEVEIS